MDHLKNYFHQQFIRVLKKHIVSAKAFHFHLFEDTLSTLLTIGQNLHSIILVLV